MRIPRRIVLGAWLATAAVAPAQSPLDTAKATVRVADQKAETDVRQAIADAKIVGKVNPTKAVERLKSTILALDISVEVSSAKRKALVEELQNTITNLESVEPRSPVDPNSPAAKAREKEMVVAAAREAAEVAEGFQKATKLFDRRNDTEAREILAALARRYPNNPLTQAAVQKETTAAQIQAEKEVAKQYAAAFLKNLRSVDQSAIPATDDIVFPDKKKWDALTKARTAPTIKLTEKEVQLIESLNKTVKAEFRGKPFREA
ncbi:MAG: hypothetical protein ACRCZF_02835, partial [Gemmataceae bacterium]